MFFGCKDNQNGNQKLTNQIEKYEIMQRITGGLIIIIIIPWDAH